MEPQRWQKIEQVYLAALAVDESQRAALIETACGADQSLAGDVYALLAQTSGSPSFLEAPAIELAAKSIAMAAAAGAEAGHSSRPAMSGEARCPGAIGRYQVIRLLGEGGMGRVFEAEQDQPRRVVALKVIKPGFATAETLRRFQHESQALGRLQHPGIAQIYEASTADTGFGPQPYFAMELIRGQALREYAEGRHLDTRERLALIVKVCDAVDHAHHRGVIHRDLKPGNILVDETGQPKILDFGVARVTESDVQLTRTTDVGQLVGTLAYMSPEQVSGDPQALDVRSDVYSLGVILYELLAGKPPYNIEKKPLHEAIQTIRQEDAAHLSTIQRSYRGDVETIVAKALEKDKTRRYASAADLAGDIRRYLADEPILARPPSASYQLQKFARRHRALVVGAAAVFLTLAAGAVASTVALVRVRAEKRRADSEAATAQAVNNFLQKDLLAQAAASRQSGPDTKPDRDLKVRTALDRAAARIAGKFDRQPEVEAAIRSTIGQTYRSLGLYPEAGKQLERAADLQRQVLGAENPATLDTRSQLGRVLYHQGKFPQAEKLDAQTVEMQRRVLGPEQPDTLRSTFNLATDISQEGKYAQAEALLSRTLEIEHRTLGDQHPDTLMSMNGLGACLDEQGKYHEAEAVFRRVLELRRRVLGAEHPETVMTLNNLAAVYSQEGEYTEAVLLLRQAVEIQSRVNGEAHPIALFYMTNLAENLRDERKFAEARALLGRILEIQRRVLGPEHSDTLTTANELANSYTDEGKYAESENLLSRTLAAQIRVLGPEHPDTLTAMENLADVYSDEGKYGRARPLFSRALEIERRVLGPEHPVTLNHLSEMASMYQREGQYALAETSAAQALAGERQTLGSNHPDTMTAAASLALAYQSQGKFAESEPLAREAVEFYAKKMPDDWQRFRAASLLGAALAGQKKYAEAEPLLIEGYQGMRARLERIAFPDRYHLEHARQSIVQLYKKWGKPDKAAEWRRK